MPIYAYRCEACGFAKDVLQKMQDAQLTVCPSCHASAFKKQVTAAGFQLKGSGWYQTDFRDSGKPASKPSTSAAGSSNDASSSATSGSSSSEASGGKADSSSSNTSADAGSAAAPKASSAASCAPGCGCH